MKWCAVLPCFALCLWCRSFVALHAQTDAQQSAVADSLRRVIATAKHDTTRVNAMIEMSWHWWDVSRFDSSLVYAQQAQKVAERSGFRKGAADAHSNIANVYWFWGQYAQALEQYTASLRIREELGNKLAIASTLNNIGNVHSKQGNNSEALKYYTKSLTLHEELGNREHIAHLLLNIGVIYVQQDKYTQAVENYRKALHIYEERNNKEDIALALGNIGNVYTQQGRYSEALEYHFKTLKIQEELGNKAPIANSLGNLGNLYLLQSKYSEALDYYFKSLRMYEALGGKENIASMLNSIGNTYRSQGKYSEALEHYFKSLRLREELGSEANTAVSLNNIGNVYRLQGKYSEALEVQLRALRTQEALGNRLGMSTALNGIGQVYRLQGRFDEALSSSLRALQLADSIGVRVQKKEALEALSACYDSLGQHKRALDYHKQYVALKDSLVNGESLEKTAKLREGYEAEKREQQIALLNKDKEILSKEKEVLTKDQALKESELTRQHAELARADAERQVQAQSILLLRNEQHVQQLTLEQKEAALTEARLREERNREALKLSAAQASLQHAELARRTLIQWSLVGVLVFVVASAVWLGVLYRQKNAANKAILEQQALLEDQAHEIHQANIELHQQNEELVALNTEKNELMGIVSHDLKNPIGAVLGLAEMIQSGVVESEDVPKIAEHIVHTAERMSELVKNLLDVNRLEQGGMQLHLVTLDLALLVESVVWQYQSPAETKQITLQFHAETTAERPALVRADEQAMVQVLDNLVSNAVKYSPHGKNVFVRLRAIGRGEGQEESHWEKSHSSLGIGHLIDEATNAPMTNQPMTNQLMTKQPMTNDQPTTAPMANIVRIEVRDEGPGLSADDMQKLFGKFARLSAQPTGGEHSTGLGLSIVKKLVEAMNGRVWCESELGKGATFVVELPTATPNTRP